MPSKKSRKKGPSKAPFVITILVCASAVAALAQYVRSGHSIVPQNERAHITSDEPTLTKPIHEAPPVQEEQDEPVAAGPFVFTPISSEGTKLNFAKSSVHPPVGADAKVYVVNRFLQVARIADPDARLLSVDVKDGVAYMYFNAAMNKTVGTDDDQTLLQGLLKNVGQFPGVKSALFFADGKQIDTFGNADLTEAQPVNSYDEEKPTRHSQKQESSQSN